MIELSASAAREVIRIFEEAEIRLEGGHKNWYGIPDIKFIWHGEWNDPEIEYMGRRCSCFIVEDTMWERFREDDLSDPDEFSQYMQENADEVYELCKLAMGIETEVV